MTSNEDLIKYIQAELDGKEIQIEDDLGGWIFKLASEKWYAGHNYRIKPEPREWYVNEYPRNLGHKGLGYLHETKELAKSFGGEKVCKIIKVREILDE